MNEDLCRSFDMPCGTALMGLLRCTCRPRRVCLLCYDLLRPRCTIVQMNPYAYALEFADEKAALLAAQHSLAVEHKVEPLRYRAQHTLNYS